MDVPGRVVDTNHRFALGWKRGYVYHEVTQGNFATLAWTALRSAYGKLTRCYTWGWFGERSGRSRLVVRVVGVLPLESDERTSRDRLRACLRNDAEARRAPAAISEVRTFAPAFLPDCAESWKGREATHIAFLR